MQHQRIVRSFVLVSLAVVGLSLAGAPAFGWECVAYSGYTGGPFGCSPTACRFEPGNSVTYHLISTKFTNDEEDAIEDAAGAWRAGAQQLNRGADWQFIRGADDPVGSLDLADNQYHVSRLSDAWLAGNGVPANAIGVAFRSYGAWPNCGVQGGDVVFRASTSWSTKLPAAAAAGTLSLGQTAIHEFGHIIGFDHENGDLQVMNTTYPFGGDISAAYRINEDDYVGLQASYPDSSTGKNFMISKFLSTGGGGAVEIWTGANVNTSPNDVLAGAEVPEDVVLIVTGTTAGLQVDVTWYLRPASGGACGDANSIAVGTASPTLGVNTTYSRNLSTWQIPASTPAGDYKVCAKIDPDGSFSETREDDNSVVSDRLYVVN